jgi:heme/copper-type cytochrome/quinol oxidase subunit 3
MQQQQSLEQNLSRDELIRLRNNRTGMALFQFTWILVFVCLIAVNLMMRGNFASWPPPGVERLGAIVPTIATVLLIASSVFVHRALKAAREDDSNTMRAQLRLVLMLGAVFVAIMAFEWLTVPASGQYSDIFRVMTAFHAIHALAIGVYLWRLYRFAPFGVYGSRNFWPVEAGVKLWDFVTVAWLMFFAVLYVI